MKKWMKGIIVVSLLLSTAACNAKTQITVDNDAKDGDPAAIQITTQVEGEFVRFEGEDAVTILYEGKETTYKMAKGATGDLDIVKAGDTIAFSTKMVDGNKVIETLRLN